jgi:hypothetical protein
MHTGQAHGGLQRLRPLQLDVDAQGFLQAGEEQLNLLRFGERSHAGEER